MTDTYTAGDFLKRLTEGALRTPLICEGFAKPVEGSHDALLFSPGTSCENWTKIPGEIIEKVELLGNARAAITRIPQFECTSKSHRRTSRLRPSFSPCFGH